MSDKNIRIARVIHVFASSGKTIIMIGDREYEIDAQNLKPIIGDIFTTTSDASPRLLEKIGKAEPDAWTIESDAMRWRRRDARGKTRMDVLWQRQAIRRAIREYMDNEGFIEIDTPLLVHGTTPDAMIQSFSVNDRYLITSSEYQLRRLEVGGFERIYTLTQNYRKDDGEGPTRNQEFTMLEWVRVGQSLEIIEQDTEQLVWTAHKALKGSGTITYQEHEIDLKPPFEKMSVKEAIQTYAKVELSDFTLKSIKNAVLKTGIHIASGSENDIYFLFSLLMAYIQSYLGLKKPLFLRDWPKFETSSAQNKGDGDTAERSELYIGGLEISNGFPSFTDYQKQKETFAFQLERRRADKTTPVDLDKAYLESIRVGLPPDSGMALGFDRLVMILTDQSDIRSVMAFAWDEV